MKSVNACNSYRGFSEVTPQNKSVHYRHRLSKCTSVQISNITKVCVQNVLHARMQALRRGRH